MKESKAVKETFWDMGLMLLLFQNAVPLFIYLFILGATSGSMGQCTGRGRLLN